MGVLSSVMSSGTPWVDGPASQRLCSTRGDKVTLRSTTAASLSWARAISPGQGLCHSKVIFGADCFLCLPGSPPNRPDVPLLSQDPVARFPSSRLFYRILLDFRENRDPRSSQGFSETRKHVYNSAAQPSSWQSTLNNRETRCWNLWQTFASCHNTVSWICVSALAQNLRISAADASPSSD